MKQKLSANGLKILALIAMTVDHMAFLFVDAHSSLYYFMRIFGRLTAPIMAFFIAEGFQHTRSRKKYFLRLAVFALISQPFYYSMVYGKIWDTEFFLHWNVMLSLAAALLCLIVLESKLPETPRLILLSVCISFGHFGDWSLMIPVWATIFYLFRNDFKKKAFIFALASVTLQTLLYLNQYDSFALFSCQYGTLFALIPISLYNGQRGNVRHKKLHRWFFYFYYPVHMAVLLTIQALLG